MDEAKLREDALKAQVLSFEKDNCALKEQKKSVSYVMTLDLILEADVFIFILILLWWCVPHSCCKMPRTGKRSMKN